MILYIGGFELPDRNAAAQRAIGIAKGLRELGYDVVFLNSIKYLERVNEEIKSYFGFKCYEYRRESEKDYLLSAKTTLDHIEKIKPNFVIAYNYPGVALERIRKYCVRNGVKCIADATEWYKISEGRLMYRMIKSFDSFYRMRIVHKKLDGVIAISRFLYEYYKESVKTVMIPPTVDITDDKWKVEVKKDDALTFIYAGSPSAQKERLDLIVDAMEKLETKRNVRFNVVGITKEQFVQIYDWKKNITDRVIFHGRVEHDKVIELTKSSDWTIILRENNWVVRAGFPTKLVESISCGIPVIINRFSNIADYVVEKNGILIEDVNDIYNGLSLAEKATVSVQSDIFDYRLSVDELKKIFI